LKNKANKTVLIFSLGTILSTVLIFSINAAVSKNAGIAKTNKIVENTNNLKPAISEDQKEYIEKIERYESLKRETDKILAENEKTIESLKEEHKYNRKNAEMAINEKLMELENRNQDLNKRINDYTDDGIDNWESFKFEFSKDMNQMGEELKGISIKNSNQLKK